MIDVRNSFDFSFMFSVTAPIPTKLALADTKFHEQATPAEDRSQAWYKVWKVKRLPKVQRLGSDP